jgi:glycosyltransferase involved in cell wall biosynthesis
MGLYDTIVRDRRLIGKKSIFARLIWWYEKIILQSIDIALVDTIEHELMLQQDFKPLKSKIDHIPVGVDEKLWQPSPYPADTELFNVLFWATFIPLHGVEVVAQAAKMLEKDSPQIYFTIIGNGQLGEEFRDLLKKLKPKNINWIDRFLPLSEIEKLVKKSHCCLGVFGTQNKTQRVIPYKVSQALAAGRPIITARTSAVEQILTDNIDSVLVRCGDPDDLSGAIKRISDDRKFALKIGKNGRRLYESKLSNRIIKNRLEHILESLELT